MRAFWMCSAALAAIVSVPGAGMATAVNVSFSGTFSTGEAYTGSLTYEATPNPSGDSFVEFNNQISNFTVTSSRFLQTNGTSTLTGDSNISFNNRIRYFSGSDLGFNAIQFFQSYDDSDPSQLPAYLGLSLSVNPSTFSRQNLPTAFSFDASPDFSLNFSYSYFTRPGSNDFGYGPVATVTATPAIAAVPEPATWAMMIAGFGLVGAALRRRRLVAAYA